MLQLQHNIRYWKVERGNHTSYFKAYTNTLYERITVNKAIGNEPFEIEKVESHGDVNALISEAQSAERYTQLTPESYYKAKMFYARLTNPRFKATA